jgi:hypothetical protein
MPRPSRTHELVRYIVDADADPDVGLLVDAIVILKDLHRFSGLMSRPVPEASIHPTGLHPTGPI